MTLIFCAERKADRHTMIASKKKRRRQRRRNPLDKFRRKSRADGACSGLSQKLSLPEAARSPLERQFEGQLNHALAVILRGFVDHAKTRWRANILHTAGPTGHLKQGVIKQVKELSSEIQAHAFAYRNTLD